MKERLDNDMCEQRDVFNGSSKFLTSSLNKSRLIVSDYHPCVLSFTDISKERMQHLYVGDCSDIMPLFPSYSLDISLIINVFRATAAEWRNRHNAEGCAVHRCIVYLRVTGGYLIHFQTYVCKLRAPEYNNKVQWVIGHLWAARSLNSTRGIHS